MIDVHGWSVRIAVWVAAAAMVACGGGGGGSAGVTVPSGLRSATPSAASDLRVELIDTQAPPLVRALLNSSNGSLLDPTGGTDAGPTSAARPQASRLRLPTMAGGAAYAWIQRLPDRQRRHALAVQEQDLACEISGSLRVRFDDADGNQQISAGDTIGFTAFDCLDTVGLPTLNGGFTVQVDAVELDNIGDPVALAVRGSFQAFTLAGYGSMSGSFQLWVQTLSATRGRLRLSYLGTTVTDTLGTTTYDFDVDGVADTDSGNLAIGGGLGLAGQTYALRSLADIGFAAEGMPSSGQLELVDAAGDRLRVVPRDAQRFDLEFWPAGATQPLLTRTGLLWSDFDG